MENLNMAQLNVVSLNTNGEIGREREPLPDGIEPNGYQFFETSDGQIFDSSRGSFYVKL